jgi:hypothetical protein
MTQSSLNLLRMKEREKKQEQPKKKTYLERWMKKL